MAVWAKGRKLSVKSTQAAVQSTVTSVDPSYATKWKKWRQYAALVSASWFNERARAPEDRNFILKRHFF